MGALKIQKRNLVLLTIITALVFLLYSVTFLRFRGLPFLDLPNHTARSFVIGELLWGTEFRDLFAFDLLFTPYILTDLILAALLRIFPLEYGALALVVIAFLLQPLALVAYGKTRRLTTQSLIVVALIGTYLATNWFFLSAFLSFSIGFALIFLTLACWERCLQLSPRIKQAPWYLLFLFTATLAYLSHLSSFTFLTAIVGGMGVLRLVTRRLSLFGFICSLLPFAGFVTIHLLRSTSRQDFANEWLFRSPLDKLLAIGTMFIRFDYLADVLFFAALVLYIGYHLRGLFNVRLFGATNAFRGDFDILELGLTSVGFLVLYLLLPVAFSHVYDVDGRALPFLFAFLLLFALRVGERWGVFGLSSSETTGSGRHYPVRLNHKFSIAAALCLSLLNYFYLATSLARHNRYLVQVNQAARAIPERHPVLPIVSTTQEGRVQTGLHNGALYTAWGKGVTPYIFNSSLGQPVTFFHFKKIPYHPFQFWYQRNMPVDWRKVETTYDFVLITKPYAAERIDLPHSTPFFENAAAIVLRTDARKP